MDQRRVKCRKATVGQRVLWGVVPMGMSLVLAASMTAGSAAAYAETAHVYEDATITVTQPNPEANTHATWDAYKIFDADISAANQATHVQWASDNAKAAALSFFSQLSASDFATYNEAYAAHVSSYTEWLVARGYTQSDAGVNAQNAAEFIAFMITNDSVDTAFGGSPAAKVKGSFADRFARAVQGANPAVPHLTSSSAGVISGGTEGYYLIVTTPATIGAGEAGTAPMWVPLGGSIETIRSKEASPTVGFQVKEDKTATFGLAADSNTGQDLDYRIVGTLPDNIGAYASFHDTYVITLPAGMSTGGTDAADANVSIDTVAVSVGDADITQAASVSATGKVVTVDIADVTTVAGLDVAKGDCVTITYRAHLDGNAVIGAAGQTTTMTRMYTQDPVTLAVGPSETLDVKNFAYGAQVTKRDKSNGALLEGAGFTIQAATQYGAGGPYYVQADGSLSTVAYEFTTGHGGTFAITGLDEGVYTIHESAVPQGYIEPGSDTVLAIDSALNQASKSVSFSASVSGGEAVVVDGDSATMLSGQDASAGAAYVQIVNERSFEMPITGLRGNGGVYALAALLATGGIAVLAGGIRRKRKATRRREAL